MTISIGFNPTYPYRQTSDGIHRSRRRRPPLPLRHHHDLRRLLGRREQGAEENGGYVCSLFSSPLDSLSVLVLCSGFFIPCWTLELLGFSVLCPVFFTSLPLTPPPSTLTPLYLLPLSLLPHHQSPNHPTHLPTSIFLTYTAQTTNNHPPRQASPPTASTSKPRPRTSTPTAWPLTRCSRRSRRRARRSRAPRRTARAWAFDWNREIWGGLWKEWGRGGGFHLGVLVLVWFERWSLRGWGGCVCFMSG